MLSILKLAYNLEIELVFHELFFETTISETKMNAIKRNSKKKRLLSCKNIESKISNSIP